jgi:hypothetical protein
LLKATRPQPKVGNLHILVRFDLSLAEWPFAPPDHAAPSAICRRQYSTLSVPVRFQFSSRAASEIVDGMAGTKQLHSRDNRIENLIDFLGGAIPLRMARHHCSSLFQTLRVGNSSSD